MAGSIQFNQKEIDEYESEIVSIRRRLHQNPELSYNEIETAKLIEEKLFSIGLVKVRTKVGGTGVVGLLEGAKPGKVVALRADMDALPIDEETDLPFKSKKKGVMHACGHDSHVAMLLGAAMLLSKHKNDLSGSVKFLFQPAEEDLGRGGAKPMIEAGVMENPKVDFVFGLHIMSHVPSRVFSLKGGPLMAIPDSFKIKIIGKGGHGSQPHDTVDPIFIASQLVVALQGIRSRLVNQTEPFTLSVCRIEAGTKDNIIPDCAELEGTFRTLDENIREKARDFLIEITNSICHAFGALCEINFKDDVYPVTCNDPIVVTRVFEILSSIPGNTTIQANPILGAEDFSRFLEKAPGAFYFLGTRNELDGCIYPNHSSRFKIDESVMKDGAFSLASLAWEFSREDDES
jgi:carboxypeptidase Ss1